MKSALEKLEHNFEIAIACLKWIIWNLVLKNVYIYGQNENIWAKLDKDVVWESDNLELLGVTINNNLRFGKYVSNICLKANKKLSALTRVVKFVPFKKGVFFSIHNFPGGNLSEFFCKK